jgi:hypothetical protein
LSWTRPRGLICTRLERQTAKEEEEEEEEKEKEEEKKFSAEARSRLQQRMMRSG